MTVHSPLLNGSQTSQSARGYTRTKVLPRSWEQYQCVQYFHVSKQWCGCQCLGFVMCAQMLMYVTAHGGCMVSLVLNTGNAS